ncbi:MAG: YbgC/FadM family acyl-CoA thioesterase, partial [Thalassovita mediterranea]
MIYELPVRVYYEDTDMAGIVYYANYLKFIERGRSEWVREIGIDQNEMKAEGFVFAVRRVEADYLAPAKLDDELIVTTEVAQVTGARLVMDQWVMCQGKALFHAVVTVIMM